MNKNDSSLIAHILNNGGHKITRSPYSADILIVNTCSVREHAEQRALGYISTLRKWRDKRKRILAVVGCMAERLSDEINTRFPFVDLILGPDSYRRLLDFIDQVYTMDTKIIETALGDETYCGIYSNRIGVSDFVSIMRGCDNFCTYCIVPYVRGRARSRPIDDIVKEVEYLIENGVKDIILLGQNVNGYLYGEFGFADLLNIVAEIPGLFRLRFLTSHPKDFDEDVIKAVRTSKNICEWFHLPLQSGNNRILRLMNRKYTKDEYIKLINTIRREIPDAAITTDVIVGFPTETEDEFTETLSLLSEVQFDDAYMYRYSPRQGTKAYKYKSLPEEVIKRRLRELIDVQGKIILRKAEEMLDKTYEVLFEEKTKSSGTRGKTRGNKNIVVEEAAPLGQVKDVTITEVRGRTPVGKIA